jgi:endonuclease YncB( thermonuclease family)
MRSRILVLLVLIVSVAYADSEIRGTVVGVHDGDTVTVLTRDRQQFRIRLYGIDAPETNQPFGDRSKRYLSDLVFNKQVRVLVKGEDGYGRTIGILYIGRISINAKMVRDGYAWAYVKYSRQYVPQEKQARSAKRGLWSQPDPVPPWEWRRR